MSPRPQIELAEAEQGLIDPLIAEAWDHASDIVASYGEMSPDKHRHHEVCSLLLQAVAAECDKRKMPPEIVLETMAKVFGAQVGYRCGADSETAVNVMLVARSWMIEGFEAARAGITESTGETN